MQSTPKLQETDPHDIFLIEPDVVLAARADHERPDPVQDALSRLAQQRARVASDAPTDTPTPKVDTTFRATAVDPARVDRVKVELAKIDNAKADNAKADQIK